MWSDGSVCSKKNIRVQSTTLWKIVFILFDCFIDPDKCMCYYYLWPHSLLSARFTWSWSPTLDFWNFHHVSNGHCVLFWCVVHCSTVRSTCVAPRATWSRKTGVFAKSTTTTLRTLLKVSPVECRHAERLRCNMFSFWDGGLVKSELTSVCLTVCITYENSWAIVLWFLSGYWFLIFEIFKFLKLRHS